MESQKDTLVYIRFDISSIIKYISRRGNTMGPSWENNLN